MAIHPLVPGIEITIHVDNQPLREYMADNDKVQHSNVEVIRYKEERTTTNFIESETGKEFVVVLKLDKTYKMDCNALSFRVIVDGTMIWGGLLDAKELKNDPTTQSWRYTIRGPTTHRGEERTYRPMRFAEILTSELGTMYLIGDHRG